MNSLQFDWKKRVVSLNNLRAMCARISGMCHRFTVESVGAHSVRVSYSNPDEYGNAEPVTAVFPAYLVKNFGTKETAVVLDAITYLHDRDEAWQAFEQLYGCPELFRSFDAFGKERWLSQYEAMIEREPEFAVRSEWDKDGCVQTWYTHDGRAFRSARDAQDCAVEMWHAMPATGRAEG